MSAKRDFTDRFLKAIKPAPSCKRVVHFDAVVPQFGIRVSDKSTKENIGAFVLVARFPGSANPTPRRIGDYPAMSLAAARAIAREWRDDIARGVDPKVKQAEERRAEERRRADTFAAAFDAYAGERLSRLRTGDEVKRAVERHAFPKWRATPMRDIRRADVKALIREVHGAAPYASNRLLAYLKTFFDWATDEELIETSPAAPVKRMAEEEKRDRVLSEREIAAFWRACEQAGAFGRAFRFMLATGQRRAEVGGATWAEIDRSKKLWTLPRERTKADRAHEAPLSDVALEILDECKLASDFVFSTGRTGRDGKDAALAGWSKAKAALDKNMLKAARKLAAEQGQEEPKQIPAWRLHDLRRTCATYLGKLGTDRVVISKVLNHAEQGVTSIYDRHRYDDAKRQALDLWGRRLKAIVEDEKGGNVAAVAAGAEMITEDA
jgi:integrase